MEAIRNKLKKWREEKILPKLIIILFLLFGVTGVGVVYARNSDISRLERQLALGDQYLEDMDYERAIAAYEEALRIDDRCVEAYIGIAQAYTYLGDFDMAIEYLEIGIEKTGAPVLITNLAALQMLKIQLEKPEEAEEELPEETDVTERIEEEEPPEETEEEEPPKRKPVRREPEEEPEPPVEEAPAEPMPYIPQPSPQPEPVSDSAWIDELYKNLTGGNYQAVLAVINSGDFLEKCEPYRYQGWGGVYGESGYRLVTSDGKIVGVYHNSLTAVFYCEHPEDDHGFECTRRGDYEVGSRAGGSYWWLDGVTVHESDGTERELSENEVCSIWRS